VHLRAYFVPPKKQNGEESTFEKKGENSLRGERTAKNIADEARIGRPVRAEFKLQNNPCSYADGKGQCEDPGPIPGHVVEENVPRLQPNTLHNDEADPKANTQWREQIVKSRRKSELHTRKCLNVH
jgi:hypothetical protein